MDGMAWFHRDIEDTVAEKRSERRELRNAVTMTLIAAVVIVAAVLALQAAGVPPAQAQDLQDISVIF